MRGAVSASAITATLVMVAPWPWLVAGLYAVVLTVAAAGLVWANRMIACSRDDFPPYPEKR